MRFLYSGLISGAASGYHVPFTTINLDQASYTRVRIGQSHCQELGKRIWIIAAPWLDGLQFLALACALVLVIALFAGFMTRESIVFFALTIALRLSVVLVATEHPEI